MLRYAPAMLIAFSLISADVGAAVNLNVVVVLDDSGSMAEQMGTRPRIRKIDAAKLALASVLAQVPDDARVGVYALNSQGIRDNGHWIIPLGPLDREQTQRAIELIRADGGTPLGAAMKQAADVLLAAREQQFYGDFRLLIVTDGEAQDEDLVNQYLPDIRNRQITVDVIGVAMAQNHSLATRVDRYRRADDPSSLQIAIKESLAETSLDPQDSDEASDFELLQALPVEVAEAAIGALSETDNRPIGEGQPPGMDKYAVSPGPLANVPTGAQPTGNPPPDDDRPDGTTVRKVLVFGILLLIMMMVKNAFRGRGRQGRKGRR